MSFFLFVCLLLIILQGPLGLSAAATAAMVPAMGMGMGVAAPAYVAGWGCGGYFATTVALPWCAPAVPVAAAVQPSWDCSGVACARAMPHVHHVQHVQPVQRVIRRRYISAEAEPEPVSVPVREVIVEREAKRERPYKNARPGHQMGGKGYAVTPGGGAGFEWYANPDGREYHHITIFPTAAWSTSASLSVLYDLGDLD